MTPRAAMLLAAGLGTRMRPLTERTAKPLLPLGGRTLIDHALDRLAEAGVETVVVNAHWHADQVAARLAARTHAADHPAPRSLPAGNRRRRARRRSIFSALPRSSWSTAMRSGWTDPNRRWHGWPPRSIRPRWTACCWCIAHSRCMPTSASATSRSTPGACRAGAASARWCRIIYAGLQIISPGLLAGTPDGAFSMNQAWDVAMAAGRLRARRA